MKGIIQYFSNIWYLMVAVWNIVTNLITHFIDFWNYARQINLTAIEIIDTFPPYIQYFALMTLLISVLFIIIGRVGGKS